MMRRASDQSIHALGRCPLRAVSICHRSRRLLACAQAHVLAAAPTARAQTHIGRMRDNASGSRLAWVCRRRRGVTHSCAMTDTPPKAPQVKGTARRALCGADGRAQPRRAAGDRRGPALAWRTRTPSSPVHSLKAYRSA